MISGKGLWNGNIDNYKTTGCGWIQRDSSSGTQPGFAYYSLTVNATGHAGIVYQTAVSMTSGYVATRLWANNAWSPWSNPSLLTLYTGTDGLTINRVGRLASIVTYPSATTASGNPKISTITDSKFRPTSVVVMASQVYNGSSYVDCQLEIQTTGEVNIYSISGGATAGYQAQYLKCKGFTYICNGD